MAAQLPPDAVACRYGGDEFVAAIPSCSRPRAEAVADDLRRAVQAAAPLLAGVHFPAATLSISAGVACRSFDSSTGSGSDSDLGEALFRAADAALYRAKARGRNHVCVA
jgi:diguanylate cyclase (GGDEF)-like protein